MIPAAQSPLFFSFLLYLLISRCAYEFAKETLRVRVSCTFLLIYYARWNEIKVKWNYCGWGSRYSPFDRGDHAVLAFLLILSSPRRYGSNKFGNWITPDCRKSKGFHDCVAFEGKFCDKNLANGLFPRSVVIHVVNSVQLKDRELVTHFIFNHSSRVIIISVAKLLRWRWEKSCYRFSDVAFILINCGSRKCGRELR